MASDVPLMDVLLDSLDEALTRITRGAAAIGGAASALLGGGRNSSPSLSASRDPMDASAPIRASDTPVAAMVPEKETIIVKEKALSPDAILAAASVNIPSHVKEMLGSIQQNLVAAPTSMSEMIESLQQPNPVTTLMELARPLTPANALPAQDIGAAVGRR